MTSLWWCFMGGQSYLELVFVLLELMWGPIVHVALICGFLMLNVCCFGLLGCFLVGGGVGIVVVDVVMDVVVSLFVSLFVYLSVCVSVCLCLSVHLGLFRVYFLLLFFCYVCFLCLLHAKHDLVAPKRLNDNKEALASLFQARSSIILLGYRILQKRPDPAKNTTSKNMANNTTSKNMQGLGPRPDWENTASTVIWGSKVRFLLVALFAGSGRLFLFIPHLVHGVLSRLCGNVAYYLAHTLHISGNALHEGGIWTAELRTTEIYNRVTTPPRLHTRDARLALKTGTQQHSTDSDSTHTHTHSYTSVSL